MSRQPDAKANQGKRSRPGARLRNADDRYGWVLVAIMGTLIVMGAVSEYPVGRVLIPLLFLTIFFLALLTSGVGRRSIIILMVLIPFVGAVAGVAGVFSGSIVSSLSPLESSLLSIACVVIIARRLATHAVITRQTIFGALCIYLFGAILFALVYATTARLSGQQFFVQTDDPSGLDYIYFSFVAITTLGFGDFTPATSLGKMTAIIEAVGGQLYLVVVVALFVSKIGFRRDDGAKLLPTEEDASEDGLPRA